MRLFSVLLVALCVVWSCSTPKNDSPLPGFTNISYSNQGAFSIGRVDSATYRNDFFGFAIPYSEKNWFIRNTDKYSGKTPPEQQGSMINICSLSKVQADTTVQNYQAISFLVDEIDSSRNVTTALEYVSNNLKTTNLSTSENYPRFLVTSIDTGKVGDRTFFRSRIKIETEANSYFYEDMFTAQFGTYILNIAATYKSSEDSVAVSDLLSNIKWD